MSSDSMPPSAWSDTPLKPAPAPAPAGPASGEEVYTAAVYVAEPIDQTVIASIPPPEPRAPARPLPPPPPPRASPPPPPPPPPAHNIAQPGAAHASAAQPQAAQPHAAQQQDLLQQAAAAEAQSAPQGEAGRQEEDPGDRFYISQSLWHSLTAGACSTVVNLVLLIVLGLLGSGAIDRPKVQQIEASVEQRDVEEVVQRLNTDLKPATSLAPASSAAVSGGGISGVTAMVSNVAPPKLQTTVSEKMTQMKVEVGAANVFTTSGQTFSAAVPQGTLGEALATAEGYGEAMDILTQEILNRLAKGKVLVVWVFDQSLSMKDDQKEIRERLEKVYEELGLSSTTKEDALSTAVVSFGKDFAIHTQCPTNIMADIRKAIDAVPVDESGEEMTCSAIGRTVQTFRQFSTAGGGRQMMIVVVSDESGNQQDNIAALEPCIAVCKDAKASVYMLGREAVFGYPYAHMNWPVTVPTVGGGTITRNFVVAVERGPETPFVEMLQTEGFNKRTDAHPSGFGPYEQVRIARETGGMFLMLPTPEAALFRRDTTVFTFEQMRPYLPDLRSRDAYAKEREYNQVMSLIWKVINDLNPYKPEIAQHINLRMGFSADRAAFAREVEVELVKAQRYVEYLNAAEKAMRDSRRFRDREKSPRWRAHYDLILAQLVAYKARVFEYGAYLTLFRQNPKPVDPPTANRAHGGWGMRQVAATVAEKQTKPLIEDSTAMLKQVMLEYPGTPWATRADYELKRGFGVELYPQYYNPNPPPPAPGSQPVRPIVAPKI